MKKIYTLIAAVLFMGSTALVSCGTMANGGAQQSANNASNASILGSLLGGMTGGNTGNTVNNAINAGSLIGAIIGQLTSSASQASIVGTWTYAEPTVQFESENWLAQAGGMVAGQSVVKKVAPYYEKIGVKPGSVVVTFDANNSCVFKVNGREYPYTYSYDKTTNKITLTGALGYNLSAYVTVSANDLALTFDVSKLMTLAQTVAQKSSNSTISSLSALANQFTGMKTGFLFKRN